MLFDIDLDSNESDEYPNVVRATWTRRDPFPSEIHLFEGDLTRTGAEAVCTSTNGRLSLSAGSGGDVRDRGGWSIKRQCESIVAKHQEETGETELPPGAVRSTKAGMMPARIVIHCVASDPSHSSSAEIISRCTGGALEIAAEERCRSVAMPVFATGHAAFRFDRAVEAMADAIAGSSAKIEEIFIVVLSRSRIDEVMTILDRHFARLRR